MNNSWQIKFFDSVESTMDMACQYLDNFTVIWAGQQNKGRGRLGKTWSSDRGNLFCSLIINPQIDMKRWSELTFLTALVVGKTIENFLAPYKVRYKWPNDILLDNKKISGILIEIKESFIIIGIGLNVAHAPSFEDYPTTCFQEYRQDLPSLESILSYLLEHYQKKLVQWSLEGFSFLRDEWLQQAAFLGQPIVFKLKESLNLQGIFQGINEKGSLVLKLSDHSIKEYHTGEVFSCEE